MKKVYLSLLSFASFAWVQTAHAEEALKTEFPQKEVAAQEHTSYFTPAQVKEIKAMIGEHLLKNPDLIMLSFQAGMEKQQQEKVAKMEKAVKDHADKIFKDKNSPVAGNVNGTQSLVVFLDPSCGYCKKLHTELPDLLKANKNVKIIYKDIPIMGENSTLAIKALFAAKEQGKYDKFQDALFASEKPLTKKETFNIARSVGLNTKKLQADMRKKSVQQEVDQNLELAKALGIDGTPTLIIGESKVIPGYMSTDEINKALKAASAPAQPKEGKKKSS